MNLREGIHDNSITFELSIRDEYGDYREFPINLLVD